MGVIKSYWSTCEILSNGQVHKKYYDYPISIGLLDNEIQWYRRFNQSPGVPPHIPRLYDYSRDTLVLQYVGTPITKNTIPANFKNQLRQIASILRSHGCSHCDIIPRNLLIFKATIFLIDFGWAIETGQDPYQRWKHVDRAVLNNIGLNYRAPHWPNDQYSLTKIYREFSRNQKGNVFFSL